MTEFISRKYGNDGYEVIIKTDKHEHYKAAEEFARRLIDHAKPMTNADRIRSMSDEELAEWLCSMFECRIGKCPACEMCSAGDNGLIKWLQRPWEEA